MDVNVLFGPSAALIDPPLTKNERVLLTAPVRSPSDRQRRRRLLLKVMAIDAWRLKQAPRLPQPAAALEPAGYIYELYHANQRVGLLLATAGQENTVIRTLLLKMIAAIQCSPHRGGWYAQPPQGIPLASRAVAQSRQKWRFIVTLGEGWDLDPAAAVLINSYAPQQLLDQPALKAKTWQALQAVFPLIEGRQ